MAMKNDNVDTALLGSQAELMLENELLRAENEALRVQIKNKDREIKALNEKLDNLGTRKHVRFLLPAKLAQQEQGDDIEMKNNMTAFSEEEQPKSPGHHDYDLLEKEHFTGFSHKFLGQKIEKSKWTKCERCRGLIEKNEDIQQCIFCLELYHNSCAYASGKSCMARGSVRPSQKNVD